MSNDNSLAKHVLVISGTPHHLIEIKIELMPYYAVSIAASSEAALAALEIHNVAAVLIGIGEKHDDAFAVFNSILSIIESRRIPVIFLAEFGNDDDEVTAFSMGAVDYATRRRGTTKAMINRINLRINASENERYLLAGRGALTPADVAPEVLLAGKTVLVADDVEINREIIVGMLAGIEGLVLEPACNGKEAFEKFEDDPDRYSLILMDIHMPVMDGFDATKAIRNLNTEKARNIPIIALTADSNDDTIDMCFESGMNDYIEKPMTYDKLFAMVAEHCLR